MANKVEFKPHDFQLSLDGSGGPSVDVPMTLSSDNAYNDPAIPKEVRDQFKAANPPSQGNEFSTSVVKLGVQWRPLSMDLGGDWMSHFRLKGGLVAQAGLHGLLDRSLTLGAGVVASIEQKDPSVMMTDNLKEWGQTGWQAYLKGTIDYYDISGNGNISGATREIDLDGYATTLTLQAVVQKDLLRLPKGSALAAQLGVGGNVILSGRMGPAEVDGSAVIWSAGIAVRWGADAVAVRPAPEPPKDKTPGADLRVIKSKYDILAKYKLDASSLPTYNDHLVQMADGIAHAQLEPGEAEQAIDLLLGAWKRTELLNMSSFKNLIILSEILYAPSQTAPELRIGVKKMHDMALEGLLLPTAPEDYLDSLGSILYNYYLPQLQGGITDVEGAASDYIDQALHYTKYAAPAYLPNVLRPLITLTKATGLPMLKSKNADFMAAAAFITDKTERKAVTKLIKNSIK